MLSVCSFSCGEERGPALRPPPPPAAALPSQEVREVRGKPLAGVGADRCAERIGELRQLPQFETGELPARQRAEMVARAKSSPVVFLKTPAWEASDAVAREWRSRLVSGTWPGKVLARLIARFREYPQFLREVLLTDGYVYARDPWLGTTLAEVLTPGLLFREPKLVIQRGADRIPIESDGKGRYVTSDGPERGRPARLLLFDRIWAEGAEPGPSSHVDLAPVREQLGYDWLEIERVTERGIVAVAHYGATSVPTLLDRTAENLEVACETAASATAEVRTRRGQASRRAAAVRALRRVIALQVDEDLPFDEPKTEYGQEDGKLRQEWRLAYLRGSNRYRFNDDEYRVFDEQGRPLVPQVCIDFIFDTLERAGGAWYAGREASRGRTPGRVNFDEAGMENRRNVEEFLALARRRPDWFELRMVPSEEQVPLLRGDRFFSTLFEKRAEYVPGDIVVILGLRADDKFHYHSFFVVDSDPLTGMPSLVAANSGHPRIRAWAAEMASAPKRSLFARVRPNLAWLETLVGEPAAAGPALAATP
ncbi:MAG TPA: hypothetical protein VGK73_13840 [Polyangiaceae bacterium]